MDYSEQKKFFETAYNTGTDLWTEKHYHSKIFEYITKFPEGATVLDLGTGRGRWPFTMVELGYKVIGLDYISHLVEVNNQEVRARGFDGKIRFIEGNVLAIDFADESFDAVTDFGLLQHLHKEDFEKYGAEANRVLKSGGYILNVSLSKETEHFFDFSPKNSIHPDFEKYGVSYHFFTEEEVKKVYGWSVKVVKSELIHLQKEKEVLVVTLLKKN